MAKRKTWRAVFLTLFLLLGVGGVGSAQTQSGTWVYDSLRAARAKAWADSVLAAQATEREERVWSVAPIIWYTPETRFAFGAGGFYFFNPGQKREEDPQRSKASRGVRPGRTPSQLSGLILYTLEGQAILENQGQLYTDTDRWRLLWDLGWYRYPFSFFGIGNSTQESDEERYLHTYPLLDAVAFRGLTERFFVGAGMLLEHNRFSDFEEGGLLEAGSVPGQGDGWNLGFGPSLLWDSRDNVLLTYRGSYLAAHATFFGRATGSAYAYTDWELDARGFWPLGRQWNAKGSADAQTSAASARRGGPHVLGLQLHARYTPGTPPFHRLALLGGPNQMRGYFFGRYRDAFLANAQIEWRFPVWRFIRGTAFAGGGDVAASPGAFRLDQLKYGGGLGLRLVLDPEDRSVLRFDAAMNRDTDFGFYLQFREAF
jgi:hypothetical protein